MKLVKLIKGSESSSFEILVNEFIKGKNIHNMQYSSIPHIIAGYNYIEYSVFIEYEGTLAGNI